MNTSTQIALDSLIDEAKKLDELKQILDKCREETAKAKYAYDLAIPRLHREIYLAACDPNISVAEIAEITGLTRARIYQIRSAYSS